MSSQELERDEYDIVVVGTGLAESIAAACVPMCPHGFNSLIFQSSSQGRPDGPSPRPE